MLAVTVFCFLASYSVAFALELTRWLKRAAINRAVMLLFGLAGLVAHTMYLFNRAGETSLPPLLASSHDWLLVLAWVAVVVYLFISSLDRDLPLGVFVLPLVLGLIAAASFTSSAPNKVVEANVREELLGGTIRGWGMLHAGLLVFGTVGVLAGFVLSLMYLMQHRRLKHAQTLSQGLALPSLERLARWNRWAVLISVPLLVLGMLAGVRLAFLSSDGPVHASFSDPVVVVNTVVLGIMILFLAWLLSSRHPTGKQVAWLTLFAFGFLLFTLVGLQVLTYGNAVPTWHTSRGSRVEDRGSVAPILAPRSATGDRRSA
jgi:ABC-type uncharacterized transport system permease subunit